MVQKIFSWECTNEVCFPCWLYSDWSDTAAFNQHVDVTFRKTADDTQRIWSQCIRYFESYLTQMRKNKDSR